MAVLQEKIWINLSTQLSHHLVLHDPNKHFVTNPYVIIIHQGYNRFKIASKHTHKQWHRTATTASNCLTGDLNNGLQAKCTCANATVSSEREAKDRTLVSLSLPSHTLFYNMLYYNMFIAEPLKWLKFQPNYHEWITGQHFTINIQFENVWVESGQTSDSFRFKLSTNSTILLESSIIGPDLIHIWAQRKPLASGEVRAVLWMNSDLQFYHPILILIGEFRYWAEVSSWLKVISQNISPLQILHIFFRGLQSILWQDGERKREDEIKLRKEW